MCACGKSPDFFVNKILSSIFNIKRPFVLKSVYTVTQVFRNFGKVEIDGSQSIFTHQNTELRERQSVCAKKAKINTKKVFLIERLKWSGAQ